MITKTIGICGGMSLNWTILSVKLLLSRWFRITRFNIMGSMKWNFTLGKVSATQAMMTSSNENIFRETGPLCGGITGPGEFPTQRPVTRSFDVLFDLCLNKRLSKQWWGWWFETSSRSLWRQCNERHWFYLVLLMASPELFIMQAFQWQELNFSYCRIST